MLSTSLAGLVTARQVWLLLIGFGYSEAGLVTPGRVWLLLGRTKEKKCETAIKELRLIIDLSCLYL